MNATEYIIEMLESIEDSMSTPDNMSIPDPGILTFYHNLSKRKLWLDLAVGDTILEFSRDIMRWNEEDAGKNADERDPIWIYLFNYGGSADFMWMFTDVISASTTPIYTVNMGKCCSAAALIYMTGHKRFMLPSATVLIHEGSGAIEGDAVKVIDQAESYKAMVKKMHNYILSHSRIPASTLTRKKNNDWELSAADCLKYGVCDAIVENLNEIL